ncbi:MAG: hypothetical protein ACE5PM_01820 [Candidatus Hydrothermarchaeales archaeon]
MMEIDLCLQMRISVPEDKKISIGSRFINTEVKVYVESAVS